MSKTKPPKLCKSGQQAFVLIDGKKHYLPGQWGSPEVNTAYSRFQLEWWENYRSPAKKPTFLQNEENTIFSIGYLVAEYLAYAEGKYTKTEFENIRTAMVNAKNKTGGHRFCRRIVNKHTKSIVACFKWGASEDIVQGNTLHALKAVSALRTGEQGTFDHTEREDVPDDVVAQTLPFLPPTVAAMVQIQGMTGMRPSELCVMRVSDVDRRSDVWEYRPKNHKTEAYIGKKIIHLGRAEQELIAPYLTGKKPEAAVFSPAQAMKERNAEKRANRQSKITPSQVARDSERAKKPIQYQEFYDANSYRKAIEYAIRAAKKVGDSIPHWTPYQLRHGAGTRAEKEFGLDGAQALLAHTSAQMTKRYAHGRQVITENMARNRRNPSQSKYDTYPRKRYMLWRYMVKMGYINEYELLANGAHPQKTALRSIGGEQDNILKHILHLS